MKINFISQNKIPTLTVSRISFENVIDQ